MRSTGSRAAGADLPLALLAVGFLLWLAFQTVQLVRDSEALDTINHNQDSPLQDAAKLRQATDALAADTAQLAQDGNIGAKLVVEEMARQNVMLRPTPQPPAGGAGSETTPAPANPPEQEQKK
jgi:hypothetical protein